MESQKRYDVFVSYRRRNAEGNEEGTHIARTIKLKLDLLMQNTDSCCFFDYSNMSNEDFPTRILKTIATAKVFVCVLTKNAMQRCGNEEDWVRREILQAKRCGLKIIFINPDGQFTGEYPSNFPKELDFVRTTHHLTVHTDSSFDRDLQAIYDEEIYPVIMPTLQPKPSRKSFNYPILKRALIGVVALLCVVSAVVGGAFIVDRRTSAPYVIGDYYNDGKKKGVVFEITDDGKHGKIISLTELNEGLQWTSDENEQKRFIGADDKYNGANNMAKVQQIVGWREKYPAFAWCAYWGEGWYLPAIDELMKFTLDDDVRNAVNRTLATKGKQIANRGDWYWCWSSTEFKESCACGVGMSKGYTYDDSKGITYCVRAVSAF